MSETPKTDPDMLLAKVRVVRLLDRLLDVAGELKDAKQTLDSLYEPRRDEPQEAAQ